MGIRGHDLTMLLVGEAHKPPFFEDFRVLLFNAHASLRPNFRHGGDVSLGRGRMVYLLTGGEDQPNPMGRLVNGLLSRLMEHDYGGRVL